jgi:hypothetical protein
MEKPNRINKRKPKKVVVYCRCDLDSITPGGGKCTTCGRRSGKSRNKKEPLIEEDDNDDAA